MRRFLLLALFMFLLLLTLNGCGGVEETPAPAVGATRVAEVDGMVGVYVPAGDFLMGSGEEDGEAAADEKPQRTVYLDAFWMDRTEVTNAQYGRCVEAGACAALVTPRPDTAEQPDYPVQGVAWEQAVNYCEWAGRRLPTEAEWEKAARGKDGRLYPWGNSSPAAHLLNFDFSRGDVVDVGAYPEGAGPYGVLDMAGNVWEWVADWYGEDYYAEAPAENPPGPEEGTLRVIRGGAWNTAGRAVRAANRFWAAPYRNDFDGFRCVQ
jgi:formylglycine-generating enzyme required for sulfatase activity